MTLSRRSASRFRWGKTGLVSALAWIQFWLPVGAQSTQGVQTAQALIDEMQKALELAQPQVQFTRSAPLPAPVFIPEQGVLKDYLLGVGDGIEVYLWNPRIQLQYSLNIGPDGKIMIPKLGALKVHGLSLKALEENLSSLLRQQYRDEVRVSVVLSRIRPVQVLVTGYIQNPGFYQVPWGSRLIEVLRRAGGVQDQGSVRRVQLSHGTQKSQVDLYRFHYQGDLQSNPLLTGEEQIFVPTLGSKVALTGQFRTPGLYEFLPGEDLNSLLKLTGGAKPNGDPEGLLLWQNGLNGSKMPLETRSINQNYVLQNGDILHLPLRKLPTEEKNLTVYGQVLTPGVQAYRRGISVQDLLRQAGGPLPSADLGAVRISRMQADGELRTLKELNLQEWLQGKNRDGETQLEPGDILYIPETFFNIRNIMELTTLIVGALGIVSVVLNLSRPQ
ncbi:MAG: SLBB domain-containing protein [Candidatus Sericytochromatia bacterium]|nr:SLBB domain-containing protein [Candidatus Sericytochromatia bacterium]